MFFKAEGRANLFDMLRRIKTSARQTYTRYEAESVVMFDCAESEDSVQTGSQASYLMLFALSYGMTKKE